MCDGEGVLAGVADLSLLKFRERDALEMAFKTWGVKVPYDGGSVRLSLRPSFCITVGAQHALRGNLCTQ